MFLGGSGKLRDGLQLQLLLPTRVSSPGLGPGGLRLGWGQRDFLDSLECPSPSVVPSPPPPAPGVRVKGGRLGVEVAPW